METFKRFSKVCAADGTAVALVGASAFNWCNANWVLICANCREAGGRTGRLPKLPKVFNEFATGKLSNNNAKLKKLEKNKKQQHTERGYWLVVFTSKQNTGKNVGIAFSSLPFLFLHTHTHKFLASIL